MEDTKSNATTNTILVILLVVIVGFIVWYMMSRDAVEPAPETENSVLEVNVGDEGEQGASETLPQ